MLCDGVVVGGQHHLGIFDVQLFLPGLGLALGILDRNAGCPQMIAERAHDMLFLRRLQDVVVFVIAADRRKIGVSRLADFIETLFENEEFQLGGRHRLEPHCGRPHHLCLQQGAR